MTDVLVFLLCLLDGLLMLILSVYLIILLSDLDCDFINTKQGCKRLNQWVLPELVGTGVVPVLLFLSWHWFMFIILCPMTIYLVHRYVTLPVGSMGVYDPTEIRNRGMLTKFQKESFIKIAYHLVTFFISLYGFIVALIIG